MLVWQRTEKRQKKKDNFVGEQKAQLKRFQGVKPRFGHKFIFRHVQVPLRASRPSLSAENTMLRDTTCPRSHISVCVRGMCIESCVLRAVVIFDTSIVCGAPTENASAFNPQFLCGEREATPFTPSRGPRAHMCSDAHASGLHGNARCHVEHYPEPHVV